MRPRKVKGLLKVTYVVTEPIAYLGLSTSYALRQQSLGPF